MAAPTPAAHWAGKTLFVEIINELNRMVDVGVILAGDTVTQALTKLAAERDAR